MSENTIRKVRLLFGTGCNLNCKYCHCERVGEVLFNPEILPTLKSMNLAQVKFDGGEPLLYFNYIKRVVEYLGKDLSYKIITNGTLLNQEIVDFLNEYNFSVNISFDGDSSSRDESLPIQWDMVNKLNRSGIQTVFYSENQNLKQTLRSLNKYKKQYVKSSSNIYSSFPFFVHSIKGKDNFSSIELADSYIKQMTEILEESMAIYAETGKLFYILIFAFKEYYRVKDYKGIRCFQDKYISMFSDGSVVICPFSGYSTKVTDIWNLSSIDWDKVEKDNKRNTCLNCNIFNVCKNYCCKDVTGNECYISKCMYLNMKELLGKYNISYETLERRFKEIFDK